MDNIKTIRDEDIETMHNENENEDIETILDEDEDAYIAQLAKKRCSCREGLFNFVQNRKRL